MSGAAWVRAHHVALDRIADLESQLAEAREALEPFAEAANSRRIQCLDENELVWIEYDLTAGDFWRAESVFAALAPVNKDALEGGGDD
jgi:hypothetical protein